MTPPQQLPAFKLLERGIETLSDTNESTGLSQRRDARLLPIGRVAVFSLQLETEQSPVVQNHHIRKSGNRPQAFVDCCFSRPAIAAGKWVPRKNSRRAPKAQMLKNSFLNCLFTPVHLPSSVEQMRRNVEVRLHRKQLVPLQTT